MEQEEKVILTVEDNLDTYAKNAATAKKNLDALKASNKALKESTEATAEEIELSNAQLKNAQKEYNNASASLQKMQKAQDAVGTSYDDLYAQWQASERQLKSLQGTIVKNADGTFTLSEEYKKAAKEVAAAKEALNQFTTGVKDGRNNVGLYGDAVKGAFGELGGQLGSVIPGFDALQGGIQKAGVSFTTLKGAIISTGIGALVILLISLAQYFTKTKEGATFLAQATAALGAAFDVLMKALQPVGKFIVDLFTQPKKALQDLVDYIKNSAVAKIIGGIGKLFKGEFSEGFKQIKEGGKQAVESVKRFRKGVEDMAAAMRQAAIDAAALAKAQADLAQKTLNASYTLADLQRQYTKYKEIADDDTRSMDERLEAADKADKAYRMMLAQRVALAREGFKLAELELNQQLKAGKDTIEIQQKKADAYKELVAAETEYTSAVNEGGERRRKILLDELELNLDSIEKGFEALKASNVQQLNDDRRTVAERRVLLEQLTKDRNSAAAKEIELIEKQAGKSIDLADLLASKDSLQLSQKLRGLGLSEKATIRLQDVVKNYIDTETEFADLKKSLDEKELARKQLFAQKEKEINDATLNTRRQTLNDFIKAEVELGAAARAQEVNDTIRSADERSLRLQQIEANKNSILRNLALEAQRETDLELEAQRNEKALADIEALQVEAAQKAQLRADAEVQNQANLAQIQQSYDAQRKANAAQTEADITNNQRFEISLREKALEGSLNVAQDVFGVMADLVGKQTAVGKAFAATQALINTYASATAAYNAAAQIPFVGHILGPIAAGAAIVAGLKNVKAIASASPGNATGGGGGGGTVVSSSFTAANSSLNASSAARVGAAAVGNAQQQQNAAEGMGAAAAEALQKNPPIVNVDTFEAKQDEKRAIVAKATY